MSVARENVLQLALLEELAKRAGFALEIGVVKPRTISLRLESASVLDAISAILEGTTFRVEYAPDPATGAHVIARLSVGDAAQTATAAAGTSREKEALAQLASKTHTEKTLELFERQREDAEGRARLGSAAAEERRAREADAIGELADANAERRIEALAAIDPTGEAFALVREIAKLDPDPRVRAAAVERLGDADNYLATSALLASLADPSPQVVITAIEALEFLGDSSLLPHIDALANHPDPAVREAADEAGESLR